jgi:Ca2+-binding EF-hand superfamily protein
VSTGDERGVSYVPCIFLTILLIFIFIFRNYTSDRDYRQGWLSTNDLEFICRVFSWEKRSEVNYDDFLYYVFSSSSSDRPELIEIESRIHQEILKRKKSADLIKIFSSFDSRKRGFIRQGDFERALGKLGLKLNDREMKDVLIKFDSEREGVIDYVYFTNWAITGSSKNIDRILSKTRAQLELIDNHEVERCLDRYAPRGRLSLDGLTDAAENLGLILTSAETRSVFGYLDPDNTGSITPQALLKLTGKKGANSGKSTRRADAETVLSGALITELCDSIRLHVSASDATLAYTLLKFDEDNQRALSKRQLRKALQEIGSMIQDDDELSLFVAFDFGFIDNKISIDDLVLYWSEEALYRDTRDVWRLVKDIVAKRKLSSKDLIRAFGKLAIDSKTKGYCSRDVFTRSLTKIFGRTLSSSDIEEINDFIDPDGTGHCDSGLFLSLCLSVADHSRVLRKLYTSFQVLKSKDVNYESIIANGGKEDVDRDEDMKNSDRVLQMNTISLGIEVLSLPITYGMCCIVL